MKKQFLVLFVAFVALCLGGCGGPVFITDVKSGAKYDDTKSYAANVLHATSEQDMVNIDSPFGGITKPYQSVSEKKINKILQDEAMQIDDEKLDMMNNEGGGQYTYAALDLGIGAAYNNLWNTGSVGSLGDSGVVAGLLLLKGLTQNSYEGKMAGHEVLYFGWIPKEGRAKEEVEQWMGDALLQAFDKAADITEIDSPYRFEKAKRKKYGEKSCYAHVNVSGGWCDLDNIICQFGTGWVQDVLSTKAPEFLDIGDSWLVVAGSLYFTVYEGAFDGDKPKGYEKPAFETLPFYYNVSQNLPDSLFISIPGANRYTDALLVKDKNGALQEVARPIVLNKGKAFFFQSPPDQIAKFKKEAQDKKFLGIF